MPTRIQRTIAYLLSFSLTLSLLPLPTAWAAEAVPGTETAQTEPAAVIAAVPQESVSAEPVSDEVTESTTVSTGPAEPDFTEAATEPETMPSFSAEPESTEPAEETAPTTTEPVSLPTSTDTTEPAALPEATEPTDPAEEEIFYPQEIPDDFVVPFSSGTGRSAFSSQRRSLPSSYDSRDAGLITPVRDQRPWQLCWAFSALAVGESYLISRNQTDRSVDLSERHLGFYFHGDACDPLGNADGDGTYLAESYLTSGNNNKFTTFALANWVGGAAESKYPYAEDPALHGRSAAMDDMVHLSNAFWINARDTNTIKKYIMQNGSVGLSIYYKESFLNTEAAAYYNDQYTATNHAITVVGWDDHYPAENFVTTPDTDGAWLCKNSLGTDFGLDGYFWLSYQDHAVTHHSATAFVFEFESGNNYTWNYHYDGSFGTSVEFVSEGGAIANIYTASGSTDGADEQIQAVGFALADTNLDYSIQIYRSPTDPSDPTSGQPALSIPQTGTTDLCGFYTVRLLEPVTVRSGEQFSVVITLSGGSGSTIRYFADRSYINGSWIHFVSHAEPGQSYAALTPGSWADLAERQSTARIKAYTVELNSRSVSSLSFETDSVLLAPGETFLQLPAVQPDNADPVTLLWKSDNEDAAVVAADGTVTAVNHGECTISAVTPDGRVSASYRVRVKPKLDSIHILQSKTQMIVGEAFVPKAGVFPISAAPYYPLTLHSSDETVASVSGDTVYALSPGTAVITFRSAPYNVSYTLTVTQSIESAQVTVAPAIYDGSPAEPSVSVMIDGILLKENDDYRLRFDNNTTPGTGFVHITGTGTYSGTIRQDFSIDLPEISLYSVQNDKKGIRLTWESAEGISGYYLYRQKNEGSWKRIKTISGSDQCSWLDSGASSSGSVYRYKIVPYAKIGKKTYQGTASEVLTLCRLSPSSIRKIIRSDSGILLQWKKVSGAEAYQIFRSTDDGSAAFLTRIQGEKNLSFTDATALETGVKYTYCIIAEKSLNDQLFLSTCSDSRSACLPAAPASLSAENESKGIRLTWEPVPLATGYEIFRSSNGTKWSKVKTLSGGNQLSWTDTSRASGKQYFYRVSACARLDGITWRGAPSESQLIYRLSAPTIRKITASQHGFTISWNRISGADSYLLLRSDNGAAPHIVGSVSTSLRLTDSTAVNAGILYTYQVVAAKTVEGCTYMSSPSSAKSACCLNTPVLSTPQRVSRGTLLQWNPIPLATGYEIYRSSNGIKWSKVKTVSAGITDWTDTARTRKTPYRYRINAIAKMDGTTYRSASSEYVQLPS